MSSESAADNLIENLCALELETNELTGSLSIGCQNNILTKGVEMLINKLVALQKEYGSISDHENFKTVIAFPYGGNEDNDVKRFQYLLEIVVLSIQLITDFANKTPGLSTISQEDQSTLVKACNVEVMALREARNFDKKRDNIFFANGKQYTRRNLRRAGAGEATISLFEFCQKMCRLQVNDAEYALLTAILIFSERENVVEPKKVEKIQNFYIEVLRSYIAATRPPGNDYFDRLLYSLVELHSLGRFISDNEFQGPMEDYFLQCHPLLRELFMNSANWLL